MIDDLGYVVLDAETRSHMTLKPTSDKQYVCCESSLQEANGFKVCVVPCFQTRFHLDGADTAWNGPCNPSPGADAPVGQSDFQAPKGRLISFLWGLLSV